MSRIALLRGHEQSPRWHSPLILRACTAFPEVHRIDHVRIAQESNTKHNPIFQHIMPSSTELYVVRMTFGAVSQRADCMAVRHDFAYLDRVMVEVTE